MIRSRVYDQLTDNCKVYRSIRQSPFIIKPLLASISFITECFLHGENQLTAAKQDSSQSVGGFREHYKKDEKKILNLKLLTLLIRHQSLGVCATVTIFCYLVLDLFFFYSKKVVSFATLHTVRNITSSKYSKVVQLNDEQISKK